jgi:hypothetical protein
MRHLRTALILGTFVMFIVTACCKADVPATEEGEKGVKTTPSSGAVPATGEAVKQDKKEPAILEDMSAGEQAETLLRAVDSSLDLVKLALTPDQLGQVKAKDFHAFSAKEGTVTLLLYVFEYADAQTAKAGLELLPNMLAEEGLVHNAKLLQNGLLVLAAGTEKGGDDSEKVEERLTDFVSGFGL